MKIFCEKVKELMEIDGISQKELSNLSGISESSLSRYLAGTLEPRLDILRNIAKVFNVKTSYLLGEEEKRKSIDPYKETLCVVTRNKAKLTDEEKTDLIRVLFGGK